VIRLNAADRDECISAAGTRVGRYKAELANLVAAKTKGNCVITFNEDPRRRRSERRAQTNRFVERRRTTKEWFGRERGELRERGRRQRPAVVATG